MRKNLRLKKYDHSSAGIYFITICAKDRQKLFGTVEEVGDALLGVSGVELGNGQYSGQ